VLDYSYLNGQFEKLWELPTHKQVRPCLAAYSAISLMIGDTSFAVEAMAEPCRDLTFEFARYFSNPHPDRGVLRVHCCCVLVYMCCFLLRVVSGAAERTGLAGRPDHGAGRP
jgi:hypothetical protein